MLGDLCYRRGDFPNSVIQYKTYLGKVQYNNGNLYLVRKYGYLILKFGMFSPADKHPQHWESLRWYIEGVRRCGCLADAEPYIKRAANQCDPNEPGLGYCQGIYEW